MNEPRFSIYKYTPDQTAFGVSQKIKEDEFVKYCSYNEQNDFASALNEVNQMNKNKTNNCYYYLVDNERKKSND
jgi:hypothetical protein